LANQAISSEDAITEWRDRTNRAVLTWQEPRRKGGTVSYEDRKSKWNSGVWKVIRRGSAEEEVRKHRDHRVTGAWKQISKQRRQVDVRNDLSMVTALRHGTWMDEESFKKDLYQGDVGKSKHAPAFLRHMGNGLQAEIACRKFDAGKVFEQQTNSMQAKQTFGDGCGRKYANSQFVNLNRQNAISRVSAVQQSAKRQQPRARALTI